MSANDPAFPGKKGSVNFAEGSTHYHGLSKREYFAAMALQGAMVQADIDSMCEKGAAEMAVRLADALIAELAKAEGK